MSLAALYEKLILFQTPTFDPSIMVQWGIDIQSIWHFYYNIDILG